MYKCEILADSISPQKHRITTYKVTYPRIIHAEMCRHRILSRNSASSRAIPFKKMLKMVKEDPFIPIAWQRDHKGMQGSEYITEQHIVDFKNGVWLNARNKAVQSAEELHYPMSKATSVFHIDELKNSDVTKQLCNRLLEPFLWHTEIITGTEWDNFFELRCPKYYYEPENKYFRSKRDFSNYWFENFGSGIEEAIKGDPTIWWLEINKSQAEIHIQAIAEMMWDTINKSIPNELEAGQWHIPYGDNFDWDEIRRVIPLEGQSVNLDIKIATARCARISYETLGDNPKIDYLGDVNLHDKLFADVHRSPFEHCAQVMTENEYNNMFQITIPQKNHRNYFVEHIPGWCRNFRGFIQYRHLIEQQNDSTRI